MNDVAPDASFDAWLHTPPGRYLLAWEQAQLDRAVADVFGFHAVQLGVPVLQGLRVNRMPHRWLAVDRMGDAAWLHEAGAAPDAETPPPAQSRRIDLRCHFDALPLKSHSVDLVVLPHTLEVARDPHETLREVDRVLVPEGRVMICGFNSASLWGLKQRGGRLKRRLGSARPLFLPPGGEFIGYRRLRDWLRLLSLEIEGGRFGCYAPAVRSEAWLQRCAWMDKTGDRWWPVFGAVYFLVAVKRVRGMRIVGLNKREPAKVVAAPAALTPRSGPQASRAQASGAGRAAARQSLVQARDDE